MFNKLIVITAPEFFGGESKVLNQLFEAGLTRLHLRKPGSRKTEVQELIDQIDVNFRKFIAVHDHQDLILEMGLGGMHCKNCLGSSLSTLSSKYTVSCSLHRWQEIEEVQEIVNYCFISPVFNSISKAEYPANQELRSVPPDVRNVFALGGIIAANCKEALDRGYCGVAVLGAIWKDHHQALQNFEALHKTLNAYGN